MTASTETCCPHVRNREECEDCWRDADNAAEIRDLIAKADAALGQAVQAVYQAHSAIDELRSDRVYDIELAEGGDGADAVTELEQAARSLRHARRIIAARKRIEAEWAAKAAGTES